MKQKKNRNSYDAFVKQARNAGFIDDQIDFLWDWMYFAAADPETFTHDDNYKKKLVREKQ